MCNVYLEFQIAKEQIQFRKLKFVTQNNFLKSKIVLFLQNTALINKHLIILFLYFS